MRLTKRSRSVLYERARYRGVAEEVSTVFGAKRCRAYLILLEKGLVDEVSAMGGNLSKHQAFVINSAGLGEIDRWMMRLK